jgi:hypothetical protein
VSTHHRGTPHGTHGSTRRTKGQRPQSLAVPPRRVLPLTAAHRRQAAPARRP